MVKSVAEQIREIGNRISAINSLPKRSLTEITGVDPDTPSLWAKSKKGSVKLNDVAEVQKFLNDQGFNAGKVDGWYGRGTARAIQAFQKKYGLKVDGDAGTNTLSKMHEIANPQDQQDTDGRGTVDQPREVTRLLVGSLNDYVFKYSPEKAEELKDTHDVVFISDFGNRDSGNLLLLPMPSATANKSALPTNTDGPLFSGQGIPLDQSDAADAATADPVGNAKKGVSVDKIASTASDAIDAAGTTQSIVNDLKRFNDLLDKLTKSPENAGTDFRHLISIVENTLLTEKLNAEEMAELKALYKKLREIGPVDPGLDTVINSALKRYTTVFPTPAAKTTTGDGPDDGTRGGDPTSAAMTTTGGDTEPKKPVAKFKSPVDALQNGDDLKKGDMVIIDGKEAYADFINGQVFFLNKDGTPFDDKVAEPVPRADNTSSANNGITVQIPDNMRKELGLSEKKPKYAQLKLSPNGKVIYIRHDAAARSSGPTIMLNSKEGKKIQKIVAAAGAKFIGGPATSNNKPANAGGNLEVFSRSDTKKPNEVLATQAHIDAMKKAGITDYPMVGEVLTAADIKILQKLMSPAQTRADKPISTQNKSQNGTKPNNKAGVTVNTPKVNTPDGQASLNKVGSNSKPLSRAQQFINKRTGKSVTSESLANDIINMMNEATFDTSTSLWRASGGGKRKLPAVKQMQQWLNNNGFDAGKADGWYGKGTARAVKAMQQAYGLSADGDAGPNTLSAMNKASPEPVDQDAEIAAMAAQTKGDLDQDDSVGAVGAAGVAAGSIKGGKAPAGVAADAAADAAAGAAAGTNSGNRKPKAGTVIRQSMYKESGIKFSGLIANAIAKLEKKR